MFQKKVITLLVLVIVMQAIGLAYTQRIAIINFYRSTFTKDTLKKLSGEIEEQFASRKEVPLESIEKSTLRRFKLTVSPSEWRRITEGLTQDSPRIQVPAQLQVDGNTYECTVRISKGAPRHWKGRRKSIRLRFPDDQLLQGIREINLNIPETKMVIEDPVAWQFASRMGLVTPDYEYVKLEINGQNEGLRLFYEDVDGYFLERHGLMGFIFTEKADEGAFPFHYRSSNDEDYPEVKVINKKGSTLDELRYFDKILSNPSPDQFEQDIANLTDLQEILTWHSHALICGSGHQNVHNIQLFYNSAIQKFQFIPWDIAGFEHWGWDPRKMYEMDIDWCTNFMTFRLNQVPEFIEQRNAIIWKYLNGDLSVENQIAIIDELYKKVRYHIYTDDLKQYAEERFTNRDFEEAIKGLKNWVQLRYDFIQNQLEQADLRVSVNPLMDIGNSSKSGLVISLGTGKESGVRLTAINATLNKDVSRLKDVKLYLDSNANSTLDPQDREIKIQDQNMEQAANGGRKSLKITLDELLLPGRSVYDDPYFDNFDKGYRLQMHPSYQYYNYILISSGNNIFANEINVECENSITGSKVQPEYLTADKEKLFALTYVETLNSPIPNFAINRINDQKQKSDEKRLQDLTDLVKKSNDQKNLVIPSGRYKLDTTWKISEDQVVSIDAGTQISITPGASIYVRGVLNLNGLPDSPIVLENALKGNAWGCLIYNKTTQNSRLNYVTIRSAGMAKIDGTNFTGGVSAYDATIFMNSCIFDSIQADDGINCKNSKSRLVNCKFICSRDDAIDYDFTDGEIRNCYIYKSGGDAIDCGTASPLIINNIAEYPGDKGVSVGEKSSPTIENNILIGGQYGIAVKDDSNPLIRNNTLVKNHVGLSFYIKKPNEFGCPTATVEKCIIWDNDKEIENLCDAKFTISKSVVKGGFNGDKIFTEPPAFISDSGASATDFNLLDNSQYALKGYGARIGS
jgi:parallel beta-helix repeat protein